MDAQVVHLDSVEAVKTPQGRTKYLVKNEAKVGPNIMVRYWGADTNLPIHAHNANELFYVLEGEVEVAGEIFGPGTALFVPKGVPYGPLRVPEGEAVLLRYYEAED